MRRKLSPILHQRITFLMEVDNALYTINKTLSDTDNIEPKKRIDSSKHQIR